VHVQTDAQTLLDRETDSIVQQYDAGPTVLATLQPAELTRLCCYWSATRKQNVWGQGGELVIARVSLG
jgi:hypothetical protein